MKRLLVEPSRALPLVHVSVHFVGGAVDDPADRLGLARITARMLRRGTIALTAEQLEQRVDALGADLSSHAGLISCALSCDVLSRSIEPMTELMASMLATPRFDDAELARLLRQAEAELVSSRDNDAHLASRALRRHLFTGHPHGRRVSGSIAGLRAITRGDVVACHRQLYTRSHAIVGISGDVDEATAVRVAEQLLVGLPEAPPKSSALPEPAGPHGRNLVVVDKPDRTQTQLAIATLGTHPRDDDYAALVVANAAFGGTFTSRLTSEVRGKRGWSYGASSHLGIGSAREAFSMWTAPAVEDAAQCLALELELLAAWHQDGIDAKELSFSQDYLCRSWAFEIETARKRLHQGLERELLELPADFHDRFTERVRAVRLEEANAAIRRRIDPSRLWVSAVAPAVELGDALAAAIDGLASRVVEPFDVE